MKSAGLSLSATRVLVALAGAAFFVVTLADEIL
jgi:hypothetical protein